MIWDMPMSRESQMAIFSRDGDRYGGSGGRGLTHGDLAAARDYPRNTTREPFDCSRALPGDKLNWNVLL